MYCHVQISEMQKKWGAKLWGKLCTLVPNRSCAYRTLNIKGDASLQDLVLNGADINEIVYNPLPGAILRSCQA